MNKDIGYLVDNNILLDNFQVLMKQKSWQCKFHLLDMKKNGIEWSNSRCITVVICGAHCWGVATLWRIVTYWAYVSSAIRTTLRAIITSSTCNVGIIRRTSRAIGSRWTTSTARYCRTNSTCWTKRRSTGSCWTIKSNGIRVSSVNKCSLCTIISCRTLVSSSG